MITANTITDEQIRELLRRSLKDEYIYWTCRAALDSVGRCSSELIRNCRARCAEILNTHSPKPVIPAEPQWSPYPIGADRSAA